GCVKEGDICLNASRGKEERISRLYRLHADRREQLGEACAGDIVAIVGLRSACTGDTITAPNRPLLLESITAYQPVISLALEPRNADEGKTLDEALERYCLEDPTLRVEIDEGSGNRIVSGMGELHLDVVLERIQREYGISPRSGRPQVVCTETPTREAESEAVFDRELGKQMHHGQVAVKVAPLPRGEGTRITFAADEKAFPPAFCQAVREGVENALQSGPRTGYPLQDIAVTVTQMVRLEGKSTPVGFHMAAGMAVRQALASASVAVLEPLMQVEISVPESAMGSALSLFGARGGLVEAIEDRADLKAVRGVAPMSRLFGFSTDLRSATQGRAGLVMRFARFDIPE
ncbi:MAG: elongation factor G, partial [Desulfovibrionaceae bacterium]|nr:elongation factor G [Desulfovibrionaceae bacterium]